MVEPKRTININDRFTKLVVLGRGDKSKYIKCQCDCGRVVEVRRDHLLKENTRSCGCIRIGHEGRNKLPLGEAYFNRVFRETKIRASQRQHEWSITKEQFRELIYQPCYYCGKEPSQLGAISSRVFNGANPVNGLDRINSSLGYTIKNVVPCCKYCNRAKSDMPQEDFLALVERIYLRRCIDNG